VQKAQQLSERDQITLAQALIRVFETLSNKPQIAQIRVEKAPERFFCDAGLGGLARWLRGAGYEALWVQGIDDDDLLLEARKISATILTTDSMLMERRILRDRLIRSLWLPPTLSIRDQLQAVFREFNLVPKAPRCMSCGGELMRSSKEALHDRIPPKTYRWLNDYFVCAKCGKLFWHGTHWRRISDTLETLRGVP
jgi:uncharacterized protein with PIN domain